MAHWTSDEEALLIKCLAENPVKDFRDIAKIIGRPRNACIGKANRLGFQKPRSMRPTRVKAPATSKPVKKPASTTAQLSAPPPPPVFPSMPVPLTSLRHGMCRWLRAEGLYCGQPTSGPKKSFCDKHALKVYERREPPSRPLTGREVLRTSRFGGSRRP